MKKFLLLLVAAVLAGGLVLSCTQPSSFEVTLTPGSAPAVNGEKIVAEQLVNSILVKWDAAEDSAGYTVYRKEVGADGPVDSTLVRRGNGTASPKGVPYYLDTGVKDGVTYQYGIVSQSYKSGTDVILISDVVWQSETETSKFAKAAIVAAGLVDLPATPSYKASPVDTIPPGAGQTNFYEETLVEFTGLVPGYIYGLRVESCIDTTVGTPVWSSGSSFSYNWSIGDYVDNGKVEFAQIVSTGANNSATATTYDKYGYRVTAQIGLDTSTGYYEDVYAIKQPVAVTGLDAGRVLLTATTGITVK
jgi:hypothetical protein